MGCGGIECTRWIVDTRGRQSALARRLGIKCLRDLRVLARSRDRSRELRLPTNRTIVEVARRCLGDWWCEARLPCGKPIADFAYVASEGNEPCARMLARLSQSTGMSSAAMRAAIS